MLRIKLAIAPYSRDAAAFTLLAASLAIVALGIAGMSEKVHSEYLTVTSETLSG